jgi:hypothetical protein
MPGSGRAIRSAAAVGCARVAARVGRVVRDDGPEHAASAYARQVVCQSRTLLVAAASGHRCRGGPGADLPRPTLALHAGADRRRNDGRARRSPRLPRAGRPPVAESSRSSARRITTSSRSGSLACSIGRWSRWRRSWAGRCLRRERQRHHAPRVRNGRLRRRDPHLMPNTLNRSLYLSIYHNGVRVATPHAGKNQHPHHPPTYSPHDPHTPRALTITTTTHTNSGRSARRWGGCACDTRKTDTTHTPTNDRGQVGTVWQHTQTQLLSLEYTHNTTKHPESA